MIVRTIPSTWIVDEEHRLDCTPFTSGGLEARKAIEALPCQTQNLVDLTRNGLAGIYHVGQEKIHWVEDSQHGLHFLGSTDILRADLTNTPYISRRQVAANPLFQCPAGATLISRSGTIGRLVYTRSDMAGMAISQDVLKVVPDQSKIRPGYLYAYLRSRYALPQVSKGTFGSIIVHIEAENIQHLLVPRLNDEVEREVHLLVETAGDLRVRASLRRTRIIDGFEATISWRRQSGHQRCTAIPSGALVRRMDAFHHSPRVVSARRALADDPTSRPLGRIVERIFEPNRGARLRVADPAHGVPFLSSSDVFYLDPTADYLVSNRTPGLPELIIIDRDLLLPRSGQVGGIIGRAVLPLSTCYGSAASEHLVRVRCHSTEDAFYLWAVMASDPGYWAVTGTAFGSSIPSLDCDLLAGVTIPYLSDSVRREIASDVRLWVEDLSEAVRIEREAVQRVDNAITGIGGRVGKSN